jgi:hypothetical protein
LYRQRKMLIRKPVMIMLPVATIIRKSPVRRASIRKIMVKKVSMKRKKQLPQASMPNRKSSPALK